MGLLYLSNRDHRSIKKAKFDQFWFSFPEFTFKFWAFRNKYFNKKARLAPTLEKVFRHGENRQC